MSNVIWERDEYPAEPAGPVWDQDGDKWERRERGLWRGPHDLQWTWHILCANSRKLTTVPPWEPVVGGIVETVEQYAAMPEGSIVAGDQNEAWWLDVFGVWNSSFAKTNLAAPGTGATILRVGWEA